PQSLVWEKSPRNSKPDNLMATLLRLRRVAASGGVVGRTWRGGKGLVGGLRWTFGGGGGVGIERPATTRISGPVSSGVKATPAAASGTGQKIGSRKVASGFPNSTET